MRLRDGGNKRGCDTSRRPLNEQIDNPIGCVSATENRTDGDRVKN